MTNWNAGYVAEIDYTFGYFRELAPAFLELATLEQGVIASSGRPLRYLELGYGQGISLAIHAAACEGEFWGTDFMPGQAATAQEMMRAFDGATHIFDQSFEEFAAREDLPEFDVIGLHGIWTWVSDANRATIVDLVRRKLASGGKLYVSYNCTPGFSSMQPLRHLMNLHADLAGSKAQGISSRVQDAIAFTDRVIKTGARYFEQNPDVVTRFELVREQPANYVAHEYFCQDWRVMPFSEINRMLQEIKLEFGASANLLDHVDALNVPPQGRALLDTITHPVLRESVRDYLINAQFRRDIFIRGGRPMHPLQRLEGLQESAFVLVRQPAEVPMTLTCLAGVLELDTALCQALLAVLAADDHAPKTLRTLQACPALHTRSAEALIQSLLVLIAEGHVHPAQPVAQRALAAQRCKLLNTRIMERARLDNDMVFLASPATGGGIMVRRIEQLFLMARQQGRATGEWAQWVYATLVASGTRVLKDGAYLEGEDESLAELEGQVQEFHAGRLMILQALQIA